jgi:hypothetical protein
MSLLRLTGCHCSGRRRESLFCFQCRSCLRQKFDNLSIPHAGSYLHLWRCGVAITQNGLATPHHVTVSYMAIGWSPLLRLLFACDRQGCGRIRGYNEMSRSAVGREAPGRARAMRRKTGGLGAGRPIIRGKCTTPSTPPTYSAASHEPGTGDATHCGKPALPPLR